jgi:hypothetical protein
MLVTTAVVVTCAALVAPAGAREIAEPIPHSKSPDVVIFSTESSRNGWGGEYPDATNLFMYGDGRIVMQVRGSPDASELRVTERGVQRLLRGARAAGLLDDTDYGEAGVTDQGTTTVEIDAEASHHTFSVYALELPEGDRGLPRAQRAARRGLRRFLHAVGSSSYFDGTLVGRWT